jgi:hypothetical protein
MVSRRVALALFVVSFLPATARAEWQIKPFVGLTFGGGTTFVDPEHAVGKPNPVFGVTGVLLGEVLGLDADFGRAPGFFQYGDQKLLLGSATNTLTGNVVIALPRRMTEYTLRPYFVAGAGLIHATIDGSFGAVKVSSTRPALDVGGGATGFLSKRVGVSWELRHFRSLGKGPLHGASIAGERLSFWRADMAVVIRY